MKNLETSSPRSRRSTVGRLKDAVDLLWLSGLSQKDDEYTVDRKHLATRFQLIYTLVASLLIPYLHLVAPYSSPKFLAFRIFIIATVVTSFLSFIAYRKYQSIQPLYVSLGVYGLAAPYVIWASQGGFMSTTIAALPWSFASVVLILALGGRRRYARMAIAIHLLLPVIALSVERAGYNVGADLQAVGADCRMLHNAPRDAAWYEVVGWILESIIPYFCAFLILSHVVEMLQFTRETALLKQALSDRLLLNILPQPIAEELMYQLCTSERKVSGCIVQSYPCVTVSFADVCGFTSLCLEVSAEMLVSTLNSVFSAFDMLCLQYNVEKIKTIGDAYMMVGFPDSSSPDDISEAAVNVVTVAVRMINIVQKFSLNGNPLALRVGAHSGAVVAGVIGTTKFCFDLWGPVVNLASRLESSGVRSRIQVSKETSELITPIFQTTYRDTIPLKGAGVHRTYLVTMPTNRDAELEPIPEVASTIGLPNIAAITRKTEENRKRSLNNSLTGRLSNAAGNRPFHRAAEAILNLPQSRDESRSSHGSAMAVTAAQAVLGRLSKDRVGSVGSTCVEHPNGGAEDVVNNSASATSLAKRRGLASLWQLSPSSRAPLAAHGTASSSLDTPTTHSPTNPLRSQSSGSQLDEVQPRTSFSFGSTPPLFSITPHFKPTHSPTSGGNRPGSPSSRARLPLFFTASIPPPLPAFSNSPPPPPGMGPFQRDTTTSSSGSGSLSSNNNVFSPTAPLVLRLSSTVIVPGNGAVAPEPTSSMASDSHPTSPSQIGGSPPILSPAPAPAVLVSRRPSLGSAAAIAEPSANYGGAGAPPNSPPLIQVKPNPNLQNNSENQTMDMPVYCI